jgi:hypothetical protein
VGHARERPRERVGVEQGLTGCLHRAHVVAGVAGTRACMIIRLLSDLAGPG